MEKEKIIQSIIERQALKDSKDLQEAVQQSNETKNEFMRMKNLWALMQTGKGMKDMEVENDFISLQGRIKQSKRQKNLRVILRYAAIVIIAMVSGYLMNNIGSTGHEVTTNVMEVPKGNRSHMLLSDGTEVWISNGSKLTYPANFIGGERNVQLTGEAFFHVKRNEKKPFHVNVGDVKVKVLGTEFAVVGYPEDRQIETVLVSGSVEVTSRYNNKETTMILQPGYKATYNKSRGTLKKDKTDISFAKFWLDGIYQFTDESFIDLANKIDRIYNMQIVFEDESLKNRKFRGTIDINNNVNILMQLLQKASGEPFEYRIENNHIYVTSE
ncbi:FecR family protein [Puteibacter caeruleilacunae]|nr:FecR family protein [Puteibacter caeruleilacunae]